MSRRKYLNSAIQPSKEIVISCAPDSLRKIVEALEQAQPILVRPSGDFDAYAIDASLMDEAREESKRLLSDLNRVTDPNTKESPSDV